MGTVEGTVGRYLSWLLGALAAASGVIHIAQAGEHFDVSWMHGTFFAAVGWLQVAWALAVVLRPTRPVVAAGAALSVGVLAVWAVSRLWGVPVGPGSGEPEPVALADALASGFVAAIGLAAAVVLLRPAVAQRPLTSRLVRPGLALATTAVVVVSTMALSPSFASDHHHGEAAADGADHHGGGAAAAGHEGGDHESVMIMADGTSPCEQSGVANEGNAGGGHGHRGPVDVQPVDSATRTELSDQIARANAALARIATVAEAEAAGYRRVSPYIPCVAAHYVKSSALMDDGFDPDNPEIALFAGTDPDSPAVGLSYLTFGDEAPEGFAGPNDLWHNHQEICISEGGVLGVDAVTEEACAARGGRLRNIGNIWMNHMWNAAGWESSWGMFSGEHPDLGGRIGDIDAPPDPEADDEGFFEENPVE
jgi:hypothetical protein